MNCDRSQENFGYDLPDAEIFADITTPYRYLVWQPGFTCVVMGNSNCMEDAVFREAVIVDKIPLFQRPTGGQTVVLSQQMLVVSAVKNGKRHWPFKRYFQIYNGQIIAGLRLLGIERVHVNGISDITIDNRKIAGSAMYCTANRLFFHAVINVGESAQLLQRYLCQPVVVPDYRQGRSHVEFVTSIWEQGFTVEFSTIQQTLAAAMSFSPP